MFAVGSGTASASLYGRGTYSACALSTGCSPPPSATPQPTTAPPTVIQTPAGLEFAVNLSDGQVITPPTYTVTVTPLNGQGKTFAKVEFLIDQHLVATVTPDATGTFSWQWAVSPNTHPIVTVILYDAGGNSTKRDIAVSIGAAVATPAPAKPSNPIAALVTNITEVAQSVARQAARVVRQIPVPVAYAFPYLLFIVLGIGLLLLVAQTRREVAEAQSLGAALDREKSLSQEKSTLTELASHYLRTPLAVMSGGVDILLFEHTIAPEKASGLKRALSALQSKVEPLLAEVVKQDTPLATDNTPAGRLRIWLTPGFFGPLLLIGGLALGFNLLAAAVGRISVGVLSSFVQVALFVVLAVALYVLLRSQVLRRRARDRTERIMAAKTEIDHARNILIQRSAADLGADLTAIKAQLGDLPAGKGSDITRDGYTRFERVLTKFTTAASLETTPAPAPAGQSLRLQALVTKAVAGIADKAQAKHLRVNLPDEDALLTARRPELLETVLTSLLDNAVAYSPDGGLVQLSARGGLQYTTLTVNDSGPGIPQDKLGALFQPFSRADGTLTFDHEGMGFSLYLDKLIMHYLGGDITATSSPGQGLSVSLSVPV